MTVTRLANSSQQHVSRFRILALLSGSVVGLTCLELAQRTGKANSATRSFRASLATRLRHLRRYGLVDFYYCKLFRPRRSRRIGVRRWRLTDRGRKRLDWAREQGRV